MKKNFKKLIHINTIIFIGSIISLLFSKSDLFDCNNIYDINKIFWILSIICLILNIIILFDFIEKKYLNKNYYTLIFIICQIIILKTIMVSFWGLAGYYAFFMRGDQSTYIGLTKDVLFTGHFENNFYPFTSLLISIISLITYTPPETISIVLPGLFQVLLVLGTVLLIGIFKNDIKILVAGLLFSVPFISNWFPVTIYPQFTSVFTFPLILYTFVKLLKFKIVFILFSFSIVIWHPISSLSLLFFIFSSIFLSYKKIDIIKIFFIYNIIFISWTFSFYSLTDTLANFWRSIMSESRITTYDIALLYVQKLGLLESLRAFFYMMIDDLFMYSLIFISFIFSLKNKNYIKFVSNMTIKISYIWFTLNSFIIAFLFFAIRGHVPDRLINLNWSLILVPCVAGVFYTQIKNRIGKFVVVILLLIAVTASVFTLYPSPLIDRPNETSTEGEINSIKWIIDNRKEDIAFSYILTPLFRYSDLIYGTNYPGRASLHIGYAPSGDSYFIPNHFNLSIYDKNYLGERYFILTQYEINAYTKIWDSVDRFNQKDFNGIKINTASEVLYQSGNIMLFLINFKNI